MALPPGPSMPGWFELLRWMRDPLASFDRMFRQYGDMYTVDNPIVGREVVLNHPELIKEVFTGSTEVFLGGEPNRMLSPIVGERSVLVLDGKPHHRERKLLMPPFHGERLGVYATTMRAATERAMTRWPTNERFALMPSMQAITFETILRTVLGATEGEEIEAIRAPLVALLEKAQSPMGMVWMHPSMQRDLGPLTGWAAIKKTLRAADEAIFAFIARRRESAAKQGENRTDVLSMLMSARDESGGAMSDEELRDELVTLLIAGHETTATALCWAVEEIARRADVLARIVDEVRAAPGEGGNGAPLPYLDATIKEVLRLRPIASLLIRRLTTDLRLLEFDLPKGTAVVPCVYLAQRHPDFWDAPNDFRPERFLEKKPDPYAWIPFGGGARRCIGMAFALFEMRIVLATILPRVKMRVPLAPPKTTLRSLFFAPKGGTRVVLEA